MLPGKPRLRIRDIIAVLKTDMQGAAKRTLRSLLETGCSCQGMPFWVPRRKSRLTV